MGKVKPGGSLCAVEIEGNERKGGLFPPLLIRLELKLERMSCVGRGLAPPVVEIDGNASGSPRPGVEFEGNKSGRGPTPLVVEIKGNEERVILFSCRRVRCHCQLQPLSSLLLPVAAVVIAVVVMQWSLLISSGI